MRVSSTPVGTRTAVGVPKPRRLHRKKKPKRSNPNAVAALKACWADPEWRARHKANSARHHAERKVNHALTRAGIPHGYTRKTIKPARAKARRQADRYIQKMTDEGIIPTVPTSDEAKGIAALHEACVIALSPGEKTAKIAAIRTVLEYTKSKPESKSKITVNTSEQWLAEIAADDAASK